MQATPQEQIDSRSEPSPMAIIGAILAQGAIRWMDRQKREKRASAQITSPRVEPAKSPDATLL